MTLKVTNINDLRKIAEGESVKDPEAKIFLTHFYLDQIRIDHRKALAYFPESQTVILEKETKTQADSASVNDMIKRLEFYGITTDADDWRQDSAPLPKLHELKKVSILPFITQGK